MDHVAIMKKSWELIPKILSGEKVIETRWYKHKSKPWNYLKQGETIYFKNTGEPVIAKAIVSKVEQYENLDKKEISRLLNKYKMADLGTERIPNKIREYTKDKQYTIIIYLSKPESVEPFDIDKTGFGAMSAWICVPDIESIRHY